MAVDTAGRYSTYQTPPEDRHVGLKVFALMLGIAVPVLLALALWAAVSAQKARDDAQAAAPAAPAATHDGMDMSGTTGAAAASPSFSGLAPDNADAIATAHK